LTEASQVAGVMNAVAEEVNFSAAVGPETDREVFGQFPRVWRADWDTTSVLVDIGWSENTHFIYCGHGSVDEFGASIDTLITTNIKTGQISQLLGNTWNAATGVISAQNPKRYVEMNGCRTAGGFLPWAFGIPKINLDATLRPKQTFLGWQNATTKGFFGRSKYQQHIVNLHQVWEGDMNVPIFQAVAAAIQAGGFQVPLSEIVLYGSRQTTWLYNPDNF
jgi:hypothetical protein